MIDICALVPAHNEEDKIENTIKTIKDSKYIKEVYVIDDGSKDNTALKSGKAGAKVFKLNKNRGKGYALEYGLRKIIDKSEIIVFLDGDLEASSKDIDNLIEPVLKNECDVTIAKFARTKKKGGFGLVKSLAKNGVKYFTDQEIDCTLSGQRAYKTEVLRSIQDIPRKYGVEVGMTIDILKLGFIIKEIEVEMGHRESGRNFKGFIHRGKQFYQILWILIQKGLGWEI
ncbi:glycosyltransferase family 2 protein [Paramaledivibacter caminithermalis]|uniref:Glycosyl transferase family 2 n=1 Tax=Paramaledivibacter caminithermalis (strain DSM 15212 / CIP 107654 / DViRD3) TaxID=1121301 RepID=A0A1M6JPC0_PARC5|nr:glycosyltransferase family 2 protein [Paramaledivibacter caminithermalis]SHJ48575.1 Glycosyl transferase family 2 [Paramaledivibacter caminithermalis DSM 15212]